MTLAPFTKFRIVSALSVLSGVALLFLPIIWMEIGPEGIAYYGPDVPDIYIYGGVITGKDLSWMPILISMLFQFAFILIGIFLSVVNCLGMESRSRAIGITWFQTVLLLLFPFWMMIYSDHVINNSDGAASDLTVHFGAGTIVYCIILIVNIGQLILIYGGLRKRIVKSLQV